MSNNQINALSVTGPAKSWAWYDFANSSYVLIYQSFLLPVLLSGSGDESWLSLGSWGLINGLSTVLGVLASTILGMVADKNYRLRVLKFLVFTSFVGMCGISIAVEVATIYLPYIYLFTNASFVATIALSDSALPFLTKTHQDVFRISGFGWGFGYLGGILCLLIVLAVQRLTTDFSFGAFISVALFFGIFSYKSLRGLRGVELNEKNGLGHEITNSIEPIRPSKSKIMFLVGAWLIAEGITVTILFFSTFASSELKLSANQIAQILLLIQLIAFPATWIGGHVASTVAQSSQNSPTRMLGWSIVIWVFLICFLSLTVRDIFGLYIVAILTGLVIGNTQSLLRAFYSVLVDRKAAGYQFGFYAIITQAAVLVGPWMYGHASDFLNSQRIPMLFVAASMSIGYFVIWRGLKSGYLISTTENITTSK